MVLARETDCVICSRLTGPRGFWLKASRTAKTLSVRPMKFLSTVSALRRGMRFLDCGNVFDVATYKDTSIIHDALASSHRSPICFLGCLQKPAGTGFRQGVYKNGNRSGFDNSQANLIKFHTVGKP